VPAGDGRTLAGVHPVVATAVVVVVLLLFVGVGSMLAPTSTDPPQRRAVALTFDDLPWVTPGGRPLGDAPRRLSALLGALATVDVPAVGFVNEGQLDRAGERAARLRMVQIWAGAGHELGNHTHSHRSLNTTPLDELEADVLRGAVEIHALAERYGGEVRYFRHPFTHTGPTREIRDAFDAFLSAHGYVVAPFTVENADYLYNAAYVRALEREDEALAGRLRDLYLEHTTRMFLFFERLSVETFGREIPQVLLLHANHLNADTLPDLLGRLRQRGYRFIPLEAALADPAYGTPDEYVGRFGPSWLHRWRVGRGLPSKLADEPEPPAWLADLAE
jgi:peptidoglycan-N-acetylglucosamine deacetylase